MAKSKKDPNFPMQGKGGAMGGKYASKSTNLSKKALRAAGAAKVARKRTVDISQTRREGSRTLGPGGKPLNGTVNLGGGKTAVYKDGRRVQAADARKAKPAAKPATRSTASRPAAPATRPATNPNPRPKDKGKDKGKDKPKPSVVMGKTYTTTTQTNPQAGRRPTSASTGGQVPSPTRTYSNGAASSPSSSGNGKKWHEQGGGGLFGPNSPFKGNKPASTTGSVNNKGAVAAAQARAEAATAGRRGTPKPAPKPAAPAGPSVGDVRNASGKTRERYNGRTWVKQTYNGRIWK